MAGVSNVPKNERGIYLMFGNHTGSLPFLEINLSSAKFLEATHPKKTVQSKELPKATE
jgi:hypothetical protein